MSASTGLTILLVLFYLFVFATLLVFAYVSMLVGKSNQDDAENEMHFSLNSNNRIVTSEDLDTNKSGANATQQSVRNHFSLNQEDESSWLVEDSGKID